MSGETKVEDQLGAAVGGDREALGALFDEYRTYIKMLAHINLGRQHRTRVDASDVVQETFLKAAKGIHLFRGAHRRDFAAWLRRVLASVLADRHRHVGSGALRMQCPAAIALQLDRSADVMDRMLLSESASPSQQASQREMAALLAESLAALPEAYREVLLLHHFHDMSFNEIAETTGRSASAVRRLWLRGLEQMRLTLGGEP